MLTEVLDNNFPRSGLSIPGFRFFVWKSFSSAAGNLLAFIIFCTILLPVTTPFPEILSSVVFLKETFSPVSIFLPLVKMGERDCILEFTLSAFGSAAPGVILPARPLVADIALPWTEETEVIKFGGVSSESPGNVASIRGLTAGDTPRLPVFVPTFCVTAVEVFGVVDLVLLAEILSNFFGVVGLPVGLLLEFDAYCFFCLSGRFRSPPWLVVFGRGLVLGVSGLEEEDDDDLELGDFGLCLNVGSSILKGEIGLWLYFGSSILKGEIGL